MFSSYYRKCFVQLTVILATLTVFQSNRCFGFVTPLAIRPLTTSIKPSSAHSTSRSVAVTNVDSNDESSSTSSFEDSVNPNIVAKNKTSDWLKKGKVKDWKRALSAAFWITGCSLGGGFLALPNLLVSQNIGFGSSTCTLTCVWIFFWCQFVLLLDCLSTQDHSLRDLAYSTLGKAGKRLVSTLLGLLTFTTLVSQISRAGSLMKQTQIFFGKNLPYSMTCAIISTIFALPVFFRSDQNKEGGNNNKLNSVLVSAMMVFASLVFVNGNPHVPWSQLIAAETSNKSFFSTWFRSLPHALPTLMQLMVYGEIIPTISPLLATNKSDNSNNNDDAVVRRNFAIAFGSFLPLCLLVGWSALGLASLPASMSGGGDPVQILLQQTNSPIRIPLLGLSWSAISTTILSCYMALNHLYQDSYGKKSKESSNNSNNRFHRHTIVPALSIVIPACTIASTSPDIFFKAISFAGSYPVLWLWGILPPIMAIRQQQKQKKKEWNILQKIRVGTLLSLSLTMATMVVIPDLKWLISKLLLLF